MSKSKRRYFSPERKVEIIREHLIDGRPVSEVCEKHEIKPNQYFTWQKKFFERGAAAFQSQNNTRQHSVQKRKIDRLRKKLSEKDEIIAEVAEAFVTLKKDLGKA